MPFYRKFSGDHWTAIYYSRLFEDEGVRYGTTRKSEDTTFTLRVCLRSEDIVLEPRAEYFYCFQRVGSTVHAHTSNRFFAELDAYEDKLSILSTRGIDEDACQYLGEKLGMYIGNYEKAAKEHHELKEISQAYYQRIDSILSLADSADRIRELAKMPKGENVPAQPLSVSK